MKLKILLNLGAGLPDWKEGEEVDCDDEKLCNQLVRMGVAKELPAIRVEEEPKEKPKDVKAKLDSETKQSGKWTKK